MPDQPKTIATIKIRTSKLGRELIALIFILAAIGAGFGALAALQYWTCTIPLRPIKECLGVKTD